MCRGKKQNGCELIPEDLIGSLISEQANQLFVSPGGLGAETWCDKTARDFKG